MTKVHLKAKKKPEKEKKKKDWSPQILFLFFCSSVVAILLIVIKYRVHFPGEIINDQATWGQFGDFIGGTLNPILAFLSFLALLYVISLQNKELKISNQTHIETQKELEQSRVIAEQQAENFIKEAGKNDLHNMIKSVHFEVKDLFLNQVDFSPSKAPLGYYFSKSAPSIGEIDIPKNGESVSQNDRILIADLCEYMTELSTYLHQYSSLYGQSAVTFYYQCRYSTSMKRLEAKGFLPQLPGFKDIGFGWSAPSSKKR